VREMSKGNVLRDAAHGLSQDLARVSQTDGSPILPYWSTSLALVRPNGIGFIAVFLQWFPLRGVGTWLYPHTRWSNHGGRSHTARLVCGGIMAGVEEQVKE